METSCKQIQGMRFAEQAQVQAQARADAGGDSAHDSDETVDEPCAHDAHQRDEQLREWRAGRPGASSRRDGGGGKEDSSNDGGDSVTPATRRGDDDSEEEGEGEDADDEAGGRQGWPNMSTFDDVNDDESSSNADESEDLSESPESKKRRQTKETKARSAKAAKRRKKKPKTKEQKTYGPIKVYTQIGTAKISDESADLHLFLNVDEPAFEDLQEAVMQKAKAMVARAPRYDNEKPGCMYYRDIVRHCRNDKQGAAP
jgi:hypothetical protein